MEKSTIKFRLKQEKRKNCKTQDVKNTKMLIIINKQNKMHHEKQKSKINYNDKINKTLKLLNNRLNIFSLASIQQSFRSY